MKQDTNNQRRRLTAAEKKTVAAAGLNPAAFLYVSETDRYLKLAAKDDPENIFWAAKKNNN